MVLIVRFLFSFLISKLSMQEPHLVQVLACKGLTGIDAIFTFVRQADGTPNLGCRWTVGPEPEGLAAQSGAVPPLGLVALVSPAYIAHTAFAFPTVQNVWVAIKDSLGQSCDLSINRYKEVDHEAIEHRDPLAILGELESIEMEITQGIKQLRGMLK